MWLFLFLFVFVYDDIHTQTYTLHKHTYQNIQYIERHITSISITSMSIRCNKPTYTNITKHVVFHMYCYTMTYMYYVYSSFFNLDYSWQHLLSFCCCWFVLLQYTHICSDFISRITKGIIMETLMQINTTCTLYETYIPLMLL